MYRRNVVCFRYLIVNTLHIGDDNNNNNNNNNNIDAFLCILRVAVCLSVRRHKQRCAVIISPNTTRTNPRHAKLKQLHVSTIIQLYRACDVTT